jgi:hypothetical protein
MSEKARPTRDAFAFSLRGMAAKSSFVIAPAIADDRINKILSERIEQARNDREPRSWLLRRRRTAQNRA